MTWHYLILSYLFLSYLFTLQSHTIKTRKADSIGILTENYLLRGRSYNPLILLIGLPHPIKVQLVVGIVPTMQPSLVIRLPIQVLVDNLVDGQTGDLIRETDIRKRRESRTEDGLPWNSWRRIGQFLDHPLQGLDASLEVSDLQLTLPGILSVLLIKKEVKEDTTLRNLQGTSSRPYAPNHREPSSSAPPSCHPSSRRETRRSRSP